MEPARTEAHPGSLRLIETRPSLGFEGKTYWHEHKPEPVRGQALEEIVLAPSTRRSQNILARARARGAWKLIEACSRTGFAKRIGTSTNLGRFEAHRRLPKNRPRKQNVLARARTRGASRLIEAWPRTGLGSKTYWHEHEPEARRGSSRLGQGQASAAKRIGRSLHRGRRDPKLYNTIVGVPSHGWADSVSVVAFGWHPRILAAAGAKGWHPDCRRTYIHPRIQSYRQTDIHGYIRTFLQTYLHANSRSRDKLQTRPWGYGNCLQCYGNCSKTDTLRGGKPRGRPRGRLETGLEAMEIAIGCYGNCSKGETWLG